MLKLGVYQQGINWDWPRVREFWLAADRLGFDAGWMMDNVVYPDTTTGQMPGCLGNLDCSFGIGRNH
jgi:alkanesulfonate monooxygenase SsuD/methylene tetrahydromethanopterin reductase-like flavin-dependent oxidoreductase (luciferase family)